MPGTADWGTGKSATVQRATLGGRSRHFVTSKMQRTDALGESAIEAATRYPSDARSAD